MSAVSFSSADYVLGLQCLAALWLKKRRPGSAAKGGQAGYWQGDGLKEIAYFKGAARVEAPPWTPEAAEETAELAQAGRRAISQAAAVTPKGDFAAADFLKPRPQGGFDLFAIRAGATVKEHHYLPLAFQYHIFSSRYSIERVFILRLNPGYVRLGEIEPRKMFRKTEVTAVVKEMAAGIPRRLAAWRRTLARNTPPKAGPNQHCKPCLYRGGCWPAEREIPDYSLFSVLSPEKAEAIYKKHKTADLRELPALPLSLQKRDEVECWREGGLIKKPKEIRAFLQQLRWPLYFLDYETIAPAVPLFEGARPLEQIPFQFSLYIQERPGGRTSHQGYLHQKIGDPRPALTKSLLAAIGRTGSIIVYNRNFEKSCHENLAEASPGQARALLALNGRLVDLFLPFQKRILYSHLQAGSASLKKVCLAFFGRKYEALEIGNGAEASTSYLAFQRGALNKGEQKKLFSNLKAYCGLDTQVMVDLVKVLEKHAS